MDLFVVEINGFILFRQGFVSPTVRIPLYDTVRLDLTFNDIVMDSLDVYLSIGGKHLNLLYESKYFIFIDDNVRNMCRQYKTSSVISKIRSSYQMEHNWQCSHEFNEDNGGLPLVVYFSTDVI